MAQIEKHIAGVAYDLKEAYGGTWGEHPAYPVADWQLDIANGDTRLGYWEWVAASLDMEGVELIPDEVTAMRMELIRVASTLFGDGAGGELGMNAEYERGMCELIAYATDGNGDTVETIRDTIYDMARS